MLKKDKNGDSYLTFNLDEIEELSDEAYQEILEYEKRDAPPEIVDYDNEEKDAAWDNCIAAKSVLEQASIKCYNNDGEYKSELKMISLYALKDDSEGLAECVHLEMSGRGNGFTKVVLKILRGEINGKQR